VGKVGRRFGGRMGRGSTEWARDGDGGWVVELNGDTTSQRSMAASDKLESFTTLMQNSRRLWWGRRVAGGGSHC
jgi:hypothetical protein